MKKDGKTVVGQIIAQCHRARNSEIPLIMIDTYDIELVQEVAMKCGLVTPLESKGVRRDKKYESYWEELKSDEEKVFRDYVNFTDQWADLKNLLPSEKSNNSAVKQDIEQKMHVLKLDDSVHLSDGIGMLRTYVNEYVNSWDFTSPMRASCILLYGDVSLLSKDLQAYTNIVEEPFPTLNEIGNIAVRMAEEAGDPLQKEAVESIKEDMAGLSRMEVYSLLRNMLKVKVDGVSILKTPKLRRKEILKAKEQFLLQNGGLLELQKDDKPAKDGEFRGMEAYTRWVNGTIKERMMNPAMYEKKRGVSAPKGVLLCGVPGCGKSLAAKVLQAEWKLPMVKLNIDNMLAGLVGESEKNMRIALRQMEAMAPCIVWIDELDKAFSNANSKGDGDGGTFKRMFGRLLTWMQENKAPCFLIATANDISGLPPEFFRSGRFDELFSVFMPTHEECIGIFRYHMHKAEERREKASENSGHGKQMPLFQTAKDPEHDCFSDKTLCAIMDFFTKDKADDQVKFVSGADIEKIVKTALMDKAIKDGVAITPSQWKAAVGTVIQSDTLSTQGSSFVAKNELAKCYLRLLRGNFMPASGTVLLKKEGYQVSLDQANGELSAKFVGDPPENAYDKALYEEMVWRINIYAPKLENKEAFNI